MKMILMPKVEKVVKEEMVNQVKEEIQNQRVVLKMEMPKLMEHLKILTKFVKMLKKYLRNMRIN